MTEPHAETTALSSEDATTAAAAAAASVGAIAAG